MKRVVSVIDLGSNKIAACMASIGKGGSVSLLALDNLDSRGITGGGITDIGKAVEDISTIMGKLERRERKKIRNVFVTTKGVDIEMHITRGMIPLSKSPREITKKDVKRCLEIAAMENLPLDRAVVEKIVRGFYIDDIAPGIINPIGLYGIKLEAETFVATANQSKIQNIAKCVDQAGFLLNGIYLSSVASANSVLEGKEKEKGVLLFDIGDSLSEGLVFKDNTLKNFRTVERGASSVLDDDMRVDKNKLNAFLKKALTVFPVHSNDFSSVVVTGGGALLEGVIEAAEKIFKIPARIGIVRNTDWNLNSRDAIIHTPTIGLIDHVAREHIASVTHKNPLSKALRKIHDIYESYF